MKKIAALLMTVLMIVGLTGCASEADKLVGAWNAQVDLSNYIAEEVGTELGEEMNEYFDFSDFNITLSMTFYEDGTYESGIVEESAQGIMERLLVVVEDGMGAMLEAELAAQGMDMTVDELLAMTGTTMDGLMELMKEELENQDLVGQLVEESALEGNFEAKDGKLYLSAGPEYDIDENMYDIYELEGDTLTLLENVGGNEEDQSLMNEFYPLTFTKAE